MQKILFFAHDVYEDLELWYTERDSRTGFSAGPKRRNSSIVTDPIFLILGQLRSTNSGCFRYRPKPILESRSVYPKIRLSEAGYETVVAGAHREKPHLSKHGYPCPIDLTFDQVKMNHYAGIIIPGGFAPDKLRKVPEVLSCLRQANEEHKLIAFICHGGWVPISAKILKGKKATGTSAIRDDLENAGAIWCDEPVVVDGHLISSRTPLDLAFFCRAILQFLESNR